MKKADFCEFVEKTKWGFPRYEMTGDIADAFEEMDDHIDIFRYFLREYIKTEENDPSVPAGYIRKLYFALDCVQSIDSELYRMRDDE